MKTAGSTEYTADADGWLTSPPEDVRERTLSSTPTPSPACGGRVVEEQFTQAEPSAFYTERSRFAARPLRVEPAADRALFVPRATNRRNGADYLGHQQPQPVRARDV